MKWKQGLESNDTMDIWSMRVRPDMTDELPRYHSKELWSRGDKMEDREIVDNIYKKSINLLKNTAKGLKAIIERLYNYKKQIIDTSTKTIIDQRVKTLIKILRVILEETQIQIDRED